MYKYETHLHTSPVSKCAVSSVFEMLNLYKEMGYDGVFITNHFLDGNINIDYSRPYEEKINFYFSDYEQAERIAQCIGIKVFLGVEISYGGTDFLIYGLDKNWFLSHPEIMEMSKSFELDYMRKSGAFIIQAHPFREADYIDHIRLFPRQIDGVEIVNANRTVLENSMAKQYAENYGLLMTAGSDTHSVNQAWFSGVLTEEPINCVEDYINFVKDKKITVFQGSR